MNKPKAKLIILFRRAFKDSFVNLWRNKVLSIATITVISVIALIFNVLFAINMGAKGLIVELNKKVDIILYLKDNTEYHTIKNILEDINKIEGVIETKYISKKEAITKLSENYPDIDKFFEKFEVKNPLPESITVKTESPEYNKRVLKFIEESRYQDNFDNKIANEDGIISEVTKVLKDTADKTEKILYFIFFVFIAGGILIIWNAVKLTIYARRKEIEIMKLVGVSRFFIKLPFALEGIWCFTIAILINLVLFGPATSIFTPVTQSAKTLVIISEIGAGIIISIISSFLASTKHLNA